MAGKTIYGYVRCRGCGKEARPVMRKVSKKDGSEQGFYYTHPKPGGGCGEMESFPTAIDLWEDLIEMVPDLTVVKGPGAKGTPPDQKPKKPIGKTPAPVPVQTTPETPEEKDGGNAAEPEAYRRRFGFV